MFVRASRYYEAMVAAREADVRAQANRELCEVSYREAERLRKEITRLTDVIVGLKREGLTEVSNYADEAWGRYVMDSDGAPEAPRRPEKGPSYVDLEADKEIARIIAAELDAAPVE